MKCTPLLYNSSEKTDQTADGSVVGTLCPVVTELRENKERIAYLVVEDVGGEKDTPQVDKDTVKYLQTKSKEDDKSTTVESRAAYNYYICIYMYMYTIAPNLY